MMNDKDFGPWIAHNGNEMPSDLDPDDIIQVCLSNPGIIPELNQAANWYWDKKDWADIIAYRVKKKPRTYFVTIEWITEDGPLGYETEASLFPNGKPDLSKWMME